MSELLGSQIGVGDFIFAHRKGKTINFVLFYILNVLLHLSSIVTNLLLFRKA